MMRRLYEALGENGFIAIFNALRTESCLYVYLLFMEDPRQLWSMADIVKELRYSRCTVWRAVKTLSDAQLIKVEARERVSTRGGPYARFYGLTLIQGTQSVRS